MTPAFSKIRFERTVLPFAFKHEAPWGHVHGLAVIASVYGIDHLERHARILGRTGDVVGLRALDATIGDQMLFARSANGVRCGVALSLFRGHAIPRGSWVRLVIAARHAEIRDRAFGLYAEVPCVDSTGAYV